MNTMWDIYIDGDNIPIDHYFNEIKDRVQSIIHPCDINQIAPIVYSQSNVIFKYTSARETNIRLCCCKTTNKNATDAQILYQTGVSTQKGNRVIIISNDKIFQEIENQDNVILVTHTFAKGKQNKLRKSNIVKAINEIKNGDTSKDVYICDLADHFPNHSVTKIREYIETIDDIRVNKSDCVYTIHI